MSVRKQANVQIVKVWAEKVRICLGQQQVACKTIRIVAIPQLLQVIDIVGSVVSIEAIEWQHIDALTEWAVMKSFICAVFPL